MASIAELTTDPVLQGGYNIERFVDKSAFVNEYICSICSNILQDPLVTPCEHIFCSECIQKWLAKRTNVSTCPIDRKDLEASQLMKPARIFFNLYEKLELKCENNLTGCEKIIFLGDITSHQETCLYRSAYNCKHEGCNLSGELSWLNTHESTCMHRLQECEQCQVILKRRDMDTHRDIYCPTTPVVCDCGVSLPRHLIESHRYNKCLNTIIDCPISDCIESLRRGDMATHSVEPKHILPQCYQMTNIRNNINTISTFMEEMIASLNQIERDIKENKSETLASVKSINLKRTKFVNYVNGLMKSNNPNTIRYILKDVSCFIQPAKAVTEIRTPKMYSFPSGICFSILLRWNMEDQAIKEQTGIYIRIEPGVYDNSIIWPFTKSIKIILVDQRHEENEARHLLYIFNEKKYLKKHLQKINRPFEYSVKLPYPGFIRISLWELGSLNNRYVKDDQLYIDICIE